MTAMPGPAEHERDPLYALTNDTPENAGVPGIVPEVEANVYDWLEALSVQHGTARIVAGHMTYEVPWEDEQTGVYYLLRRMQGCAARRRGLYVQHYTLKACPRPDTDAVFTGFLYCALTDRVHKYRDGWTRRNRVRERPEQAVAEFLDGLQTLPLEAWPYMPASLVDARVDKALQQIERELGARQRVRSALVGLLGHWRLNQSGE